MILAIGNIGLTWSKKSRANLEASRISKIPSHIFAPRLFCLSQWSLNPWCPPNTVIPITVSTNQFSLSWSLSPDYTSLQILFQPCSRFLWQNMLPIWSLSHSLLPGEFSYRLLGPTTTPRATPSAFTSLTNRLVYPISPVCSLQHKKTALEYSQCWCVNDLK